MGSEKPPHLVYVSAKIIGPVVTVDTHCVDWGKINVLENIEQTITLTNKAPIAAKFTTKLQSRATAGATQPTFSVKVYAFELAFFYRRPWASRPTDGAIEGITFFVHFSRF